MILTLANKSQLGQDTDMEQNSHDLSTSLIDKGLDFGQQTNANWILNENHSMEGYSLNIN